ncbi:MAG: hypothetical protein ACLFNT_05155, partial [Spirochaetales bacterium]
MAASGNSAATIRIREPAVWRNAAVSAGDTVETPAEGFNELCLTAPSIVVIVLLKRFQEERMNEIDW